MAVCVRCGTEVQDGERSCLSCGTALDDSFQTQTFISSSPQTRGQKRDSRSSSSSRSGGRFAPGELLGGRYRIVAMLGKGGMGEVYRADDLSLDQTVALKFLPPAVTHNEQALERFRNEVRIARQVSHPMFAVFTTSAKWKDSITSRWNTSMERILVPCCVASGGFPAMLYERE